MKLPVIILISTLLGAGSMHAMELLPAACLMTRTTLKDPSPTVADPCPYGFCCFKAELEKSMGDSRDMIAETIVRDAACQIRWRTTATWFCCLPCTLYACYSNNANPPQPNQ